MPPPTHINGSTCPVAICEWSSAAWSPSEKRGITYLYPYSRPSGTSGHANIVQDNLLKIAPGVDTIYCLNSSDMMLQQLQIFNSQPPQADDWKIENHSWIGSIGGGEHWVIQASDFKVQRDKILVVAGLNNNTQAVPPLYCQFFNGIAVGRASGSHSRGGTTNTHEIPGRLKPDIVADAGYTSYATPQVVGAAALLYDGFQKGELPEEFDYPVVMKACILTGAVKESRMNWKNEWVQPLHTVWGAGMLNVPRMWRVAKSFAKLVQINRGGARSYLIPRHGGGEFAVTACWNRTLTMRNGREYAYTQPRVHLRLLDHDGKMIDQSISDIDNVQHLWFADLPFGKYTLELTCEGADAEVGLAVLHTPVSSMPEQPAEEAPPVYVPPAERDIGETPEVFWEDETEGGFELHLRAEGDFKLHVCGLDIGYYGSQLDAHGVKETVSGPLHLSVLRFRDRVAVVFRQKPDESPSLLCIWDIDTTEDNKSVLYAVALTKPEVWEADFLEHNL